MEADGTWSLINLASLTGFSNASSYLAELTAKNGGEIDLASSGASVIGVMVSISGGSQIRGSLEIGANSILTGSDGTLVGNLTNRNIVRPGASQFAKTTGTVRVAGKTWQPNYQSSTLSLVTTEALQVISPTPREFSPDGDDLSNEDLALIVDAAIERYVLLTGTPAVRDVLANVQFRIQDLSGTYVGLASSTTIWIDRDAAGFGWFVDSTPFDDEEFDSHGDAISETAADGKVDLLSVVMHEFGHVLGLVHDDDHAHGLMAPMIDLSERLEIRPALIDKLFDGDLTFL